MMITFLHSGNMTELSLSGKRATEFDGERVLEVGQKKPCHSYIRWNSHEVIQRQAQIP